MPELAKSLSLDGLQMYVKEIEIERGFAEQSALEKCLLLGEEMGELFKAVREASGLSVDETSTHRDVAHELADILLFVAAIANRYDIRLQGALEEKERVNAARRWRVRP